MRHLITAAMAGSVLAISLMTEPAVSLPLGAEASPPDTAIQKVQRKKGGPESASPGAYRLHETGKHGYRAGNVQRGHKFYFSGRRGGVPTCGALRRRAVDTDSRYWWRRYEACRAGLGG